MCTAASYRTRFHYFGRNLDLERSYGQTITVTPRNMPLPHRSEDTQDSHLAMIGMALVVDGYPLYFDATNEDGLSMAGLNFPDNARYNPAVEGKHNITPFEFIPWVLGTCRDVEEARDLISETNLLDEPFSYSLPLSPLHWMVSDKDSSIVVESTSSGMNIYDNPVGVLTNNPPFPYHMTNLANYMALSPRPPENRSNIGGLTAYSRGMGAMGLPGDLSSASRFVKAAFVRNNSVCGDTDEEGITQFFHILDSVQQQRGCCDLGDGQYEITVYSSCCNTDTGVYYCKTYGNSRIQCVDMHRTDLDSDRLDVYQLEEAQDIVRLDRR